MLDSPQFQSEFCDYLIHTGNSVLYFSVFSFEFHTDIDILD